MDKFSHLDNKNRPTMVDVGDKEISHRAAVARSIVMLSEKALTQLQDGDIRTKKGSVFQTAIIAGIMAAKKTGDLIPLCHPLALDNCHIDISLNEKKEVIIDCTASIHARTGVEMEALVGASVAALTIYDMCKAFGHGIIIKETRLLEKTGGKKDIKL